MDSSLSNELSESARITLRFTDTDGIEESFDFKKNGDLMHLLDHNYRQVHVLNTDPDRLASIKFEWSHAPIDILFPGTMKVDHIELVPLNHPIRDG